MGEVRWLNEAGRLALAEALPTFSGAAVESISEPDLLTPGRYPWLDGYPLSEIVLGSVEHLHDEHEADIRNWLETKDG